MIRLATLLLLALALPGVAAAQAGPNCYSEFGAAPAALGLAKVNAVGPDGRLHFSADPATGKPCPLPRCQLRAYVVKGDEVVTGARQGAFVCVWYKPRGRQVSHGTLGFLRADALTALPVAPAPPLAAWRGKWVRDRELGLETSVTLRPAPGGRLKVTGTALFAHSYRDIARGAVNDGELDDVIDIRGRFAGFFLPGPNGRLRAPGDDDCKVGMALLGDWLVVADNNVCGGLNVTFSGVYRHDR